MVTHLHEKAKIQLLVRRILKTYYKQIKKTELHQIFVYKQHRIQNHFIYTCFKLFNVAIKWLSLKQCTSDFVKIIFYDDVLKKKKINK